MYLLMNIGCMECGVSSNVVGIYQDKAAAEAFAEKLGVSHGWREGGQNSFEVFDLPEPEITNDEYTKEVSDANT